VDDNLQDDQIRNLELWSWEFTYKISHEMKLGKKVLVHCAAGMQRSAACVAMFLVSQFRCTTDEAIAYTKSRRPIAFYGNANFYRSIRGFENSFRKFILEKGLSEKLPRLRLPTDQVSRT
jgi:protein-tyrosine phosphatase